MEDNLLEYKIKTSLDLHLKSEIKFTDLEKRIIILEKRVFALIIIISLLSDKFKVGQSLIERLF